MLSETLTAALKYPVVERGWRIVVAPLEHPDMLWFVTPLIVALLVFEFYFGGHRREELGWNSAVANSLMLVFVSLSLLRVIYAGLTPVEVYNAVVQGVNDEFFWGEQTVQVLIALFVLGEGVFLFFTNFFHLMPKVIAFKISSALPINLTAYLATVLVFSHLYQDPIPLDSLTLFATVVLLFLLVALFGVLHFLEKAVTFGKS